MDSLDEIRGRHSYSILFEGGSSDHGYLGQDDVRLRKKGNGLDSVIDNAAGRSSKNILILLRWLD